MRTRSCIALTLALGASALAGEAVAQQNFGHIGEQTVQLYTLRNHRGMEVRIMTYGAAIVSLKVPDRHGQSGDVVLGFDSLDPYVAGVPYYGATVGRFANRIAGARFALDGKTYELSRNDGPNSLHGGARGFDKRIWTVDAERSKGAVVALHYVSAEGEEGYPGTVTAHVVYSLGEDNSLAIEYSATTTAATPLNLANHAYFNLTGDSSRPILDHQLIINADRFTPVDTTLIPTGELRPVAHTPFDFRTAHAIGERINEADEQLKLGHGYDHNWVLNRSGPGLSTAATLTEPTSGRRLTVQTTQPGLQFYSGNFMDGKPAGAGTVFAYRTGLCLETQHFPDSPNQHAFPNSILRPGETYQQKTVLNFGVAR